MIVYIFLIDLIITTVILISSAFDRAKSKNCRKGIYVSVGICIVLFALCLNLNGIYRSEANELQAQYNDIILYSEIVELCDNEQVRFGHYEKIKAFNEKYDHLANIAENFMFGTLVPMDWSADMSKIDFYFRGIDYGYKG